MTDLGGASVSASDSAFDVTAVQTATTVSASRVSVTYGTPVTFTATVAAQTGSTAPTAGSVDFYDTTSGHRAGGGQHEHHLEPELLLDLQLTAKQLNATAGDTITAMYPPGSGFNAQQRRRDPDGFGPCLDAARSRWPTRRTTRSATGAISGGSVSGLRRRATR